MGFAVAVVCFTATGQLITGANVIAAGARKVGPWASAWELPPLA